MGSLTPTLERQRHVDNGTNRCRFFTTWGGGVTLSWTVPPLFVSRTDDSSASLVARGLSDSREPEVLVRTR